MPISRDRPERLVAFTLCFPSSVCSEKMPKQRKEKMVTDDPRKMGLGVPKQRSPAPPRSHPGCPFPAASYENRGPKEVTTASGQSGDPRRSLKSVLAWGRVRQDRHLPRLQNLRGAKNSVINRNSFGAFFFFFFHFLAEPCGIKPSPSCSGSVTS